MTEKLPSIFRSVKRTVRISYDIFIAALSFPISLILRDSNLGFDLLFTDDRLIVFIIILTAKALMLYVYKCHRGIWRFTSINDLFQILKAVTSSTIISITLISLWNRLDSIPRTVFIIDWMINVFFMCGARIAFRIWIESSSFSKQKMTRTLVVGAGMAGEQIIRDLKRSKNHGVEVVGLLDDSYDKRLRTIHGVRVLGNTSDLSDIIISSKIDQVFITMPSAGATVIRELSENSKALGVKTLTLPGINEIANGKVQISQLRPIKIEDLLGRDPIELNSELLQTMITNKVLLVSGAGGSIGGELCCQILKFRPKKLVLYEQCEFFVYKTSMKLAALFPNIEIISIVGDVRDKKRVEDVINEFRPEIVLHAAAYKHVPIMESNPIEAVKTNVFGTKSILEASIKANVSKFVMVSTDKAVNPTNVMGATKRIAEQVCQILSNGSSTKVSIVRFGNVLGSSGSVVPHFLNQIRNGGPLTVTHPEITRYFMSIAEACQLVLQAGSLSKGNEIFVLDMGSPVKIVDLASDLLKLTDADENSVKIEFTGLRPGEKLYEELLTSEENTMPTPHKKIKIARATSPYDGFLNDINLLLDSRDIKEVIKKLVPEYKEQDI